MKAVPFTLSNPLYNLQIVPQPNGRTNVHIVVGSNRNGGGYNYEMNLPVIYKEMLRKWEAAGVVVTKKYIRSNEGLTFNSEDEALEVGIRMANSMGLN